MQTPSSSLLGIKTHHKYLFPNQKYLPGHSVFVHPQPSIPQMKEKEFCLFIDDLKTFTQKTIEKNPQVSAWTLYFEHNSDPKKPFSLHSIPRVKGDIVPNDKIYTYLNNLKPFDFETAEKLVYDPPSSSSSKSQNKISYSPWTLKDLDSTSTTPFPTKNPINLLDDSCDLLHHTRTIFNFTNPTHCYFGYWKIPKDVEIFLETPFWFGSVNLRPIIPGHILLFPKRVISSFIQLETPEIVDFQNAYNICAKALTEMYLKSNQSFICALQDGPDAGGTVPHFHLHLIPKEADLEHGESDILEDLSTVEMKLERDRFVKIISKMS